MTTKKNGESLYWAVEHMAAKIQQKVAESNAKRGGRTVLITRRKLADAEIVLLEDAGVEVVDGNTT